MPTDGWMIGYTPQFGVAVWIGGQPVLNRTDNPAAQVYQEFMNSASSTMGLPAAAPFPPRPTSATPSRTVRSRASPG